MIYLTPRDLAACVALAVLAALTAAAWLPVPVAILTLVLTFGVAAITICDARHFIIPDALSLPAIPAGVFAFWLIQGGDGVQAIMLSSLGALLGGGSLYLIKAGYEYLTGNEGLGLGDVKLLAAGGAWLGPGYLAATLLLASFAALVAVLMAIIGKRGISRKTPLPFGAFLAPAIWLVWIYGQLPT
jgi:leader peptidase (prepilin peptidase) / N-methyltransferase